MSIETEKFGRLPWFIWVLLNSLHGVRRWKGREHPEATVEDVVDHTFASNTITAIVIMLEKRAGTTDVDFVQLFLLSHFHDNPEGVVGDVNYYVKNDPRISESLKVIEQELFGSLLREFLPEELAQDEEKILALEKGLSKTSQLFDAIEKIGYMAFAIYEVANFQRQSFYKTLIDNYGFLEKYALIFPDSVGLIWQGMKPVVDDLLSQRPVL